MSASQTMIQAVADSITKGYWVWQLLIVAVMVLGLHLLEKRKKKCQKEPH